MTAGRARPRAGPTKDREFLDLVGAIYDVALAPGDLPLLLSRLVRSVGALWSPMSIASLDGAGTFSFHNAEGDPDHLLLFNSRYVTAERNPATPLLLASRPGTIIRRERYFTDGDWEHREVYQQIYRPIGCDASLGIVLCKSRHFFVPLGLMRPKSLGPYARDDILMLERVMPHLMRAMQVLLRLNDLAERNAVGAALWDRLPYGVILLDESSRLMWANRSAETILSAGEGLGSRAGVLRATRADRDAVLQGLIDNAAATSTGRGSDSDSGGYIALPRAGGRRPLALLVAPFPIDRGEVFVARRAAVVLFVSDPERQAMAPPQRLAQLFGLTAREAQLLALLVDGLDLQGAGERLAIGSNTVRTHLKRIFEKTGTHRQSELIGLVLRSTMVLAEEDLRRSEGGRWITKPS